VLSARPTPRSSRGGPPCRGARHEESNLEPRQLGAAGANHHRGIGAECAAERVRGGDSTPSAHVEFDQLAGPRPRGSS